MREAGDDEAQMLDTDFVEMLQSNFIGHVRIIQSLQKFMPAGSHIVNIGSMGGYQVLEWSVMEKDIIEKLFL